MSCWSRAGDKAPFVTPRPGMPAAGMLPAAGPGGRKAGTSSSSPSDAFGTLRKVGHCVLSRFQETGLGGMKSRQLARLHPPGRRENPFPATEALLWHSRLQRTRADPIRKPWMWHCLLCTPLALPREQKNSLPAFPSRGSSWCQGLRWHRLGTLRSPAAMPGHTRRKAVLEPAPILLLWRNFWEMGAPQAGTAAPTPGEGHPEVGTTPPCARAGQSRAPLPAVMLPLPRPCHTHSAHIRAAGPACSSCHWSQ